MSNQQTDVFYVYGLFENTETPTRLRKRGFYLVGNIVKGRKDKSISGKFHNENSTAISHQ